MILVVSGNKRFGGINWMQQVDGHTCAEYNTQIQEGVN